MCRNLHLLWFLIATTQLVWCFFNVCHSRKSDVLSDEECADLYFEPSETETTLGHIDLSLNDNTLNITPRETTWKIAFLRISQYNNKLKRFCSKLSNQGIPSYCINFTSEVRNETFLLEYKAEKFPESNSRKFLFSIPPLKSIPLFSYIDFTDTSHLIVKAQKYPSNLNITHYKVEGYKEKNNVTSLQDFRLFSYDKEVSYEFNTYNDEGIYYFKILILSDNCANDLCLQQSTPKIFIGRRSTRLVIGIVGASFIIPFVLFIFHVITKKYTTEEKESEEETEIVVAYKSSSFSKKHNEVVVTLAALLEKFNKNHVNVNVIDLTKSSKKLPEKFCTDSLSLAKVVVYVAPPRSDPESFTIDKALSEKQLYGVIFDYCANKLPQLFGDKTFKLFEEFDKFLQALNISNPNNHPLYLDLQRKTEEAKFETEQYLNPEALPQIIVTEEPQEHDSLISTNVFL